MAVLKSWQQGLLIKKYVQEVFPLVNKELDKWVTKLEDCPSKVLQEQGLASIDSKSFHALGGSIYALYPGVNTEAFVVFVVALQTISDYLDNLCDRAGVYDEMAFRQLHLAVTAALDPEQDSDQEYYKYYPYTDDGGYLSSLVAACQEIIREWLPSYAQVKEEMLHLAGLYSDLQSLKHLSLDTREIQLLEWAEKNKQPDLSPWEFAAATGSTLGMFMLAASSGSNLAVMDAKKISEAYFPWISGLHILLDYFIDQEEDHAEGDLNFVFYYASPKECEERLKVFLRQGLEKAQILPQFLFHLTVVKGLLAMYLSDPKALVGVKAETTRNLIKKGGFKVAFLHWICQILRRRGRL